MRKTWECVDMDSKMINQKAKFINLCTCTRDSEFKRLSDIIFWLH